MLRLLFATGSSALLLVAQQPQAAGQLIPTLLSPAEDSVAPAVREARSKVFHGRVSIFEPGPPPMIYVSLKRMAELPLDQSDTVVVGEVTRVQPFLTHDGLSLYTECTLQVFETVKSASPVTKESIALLRIGGAARLSDGRIVGPTVEGDGGFPIVGRQYLFFLKYRPEAQAYLQYKMWIVQYGRIRAVSPDDIARVKRRTSVYDGWDLGSVLASLKVGVSADTP